MKTITPIATTSNRIVESLRHLLDRSNYLVQLLIFYLLSYALFVLYLPLAALSEAMASQSGKVGPKSAFAAVSVLGESPQLSLLCVAGLADTRGERLL